MITRRGSMLGLFLTDRAALCAEVTGGGAGASVRRLGRCVFDAGATPAAAGATLSAFLKAHDFAATRVVVGLPARSLLTQDRELPPGSVVDMQNVLRLHAERMTAAAGSELVVDYATRDLNAAGCRMLLVGVLKSRLDEIEKIVTAAGLTLAGATPAALSLHACATGFSGIILVGEGGTEIVLGAPNDARQLRHIGTTATTAESTSRLSMDLKRTLSLAGAGSSTGLAAWSGTPVTVTALAEQSGLPLGEPDLLAAMNTRVESAALNGAANGLTSASFAPAIAVAAEALRKDGLAIDFLKPRLAVPVTRRFGRQAILAALAGVAVVVGAIAFHQHAGQREQDAEALEVGVKERAPIVKAAQANIDRVSFGRSFFENRPPVLDALREVSLSFDFGEPIWVSSFNLRDTGVGEIQGRATQRDLVQTVQERLRRNPRFSSVTLINQQDAGGRTSEVAFRMGFTYVGKK